MTLGELQNSFCRPKDGHKALAIEDFFVIAAAVLGQNKASLLAHPEQTISPDTEKALSQLLLRRLEHEPVAYLLGSKEFYGRRFLVNSATLIPRPETEEMIEHIKHDVASFSEDTASIDVVDIGTGSGNIIVTLKKEITRERMRFFGLDISSAALEVAQKNASLHDASSIIFLHSDLLSAYVPYLQNDTHLILAANLPYLSQTIFASSPEDVKNFEPQSALLSEQEGLAHYFSLLHMISSLLPLMKSILLYMEISPEQSRTLSSSITQQFPEAKVRIIPDLSGKERFVRVAFSVVP